MIEADGLCKYYGPFIAIEDVSFRVPRGEVVAFLGPNGAGKSTTMKILTGYLAPSAGTARIAGHDMSTDRLAGATRLGYLPENGPLYPDMTPRTLLEFFADARGMSKRQKEERIEAVVRGLARFPQRGAYPSELLALGIRDFRETAFKPYRVIYRVEGRKVLVYLIADGRRDLQTLLSRRLLAPVEIYSAERIREFDAAEADLDKLLRGKKKPRR